MLERPELEAMRVGDRTRIKVDAFNSSEHGFAEGKVIWVSPDVWAGVAPAPG